ncbi:MAG: alpha/beta hydrolase [Candidatus Paceibacterota bacterium]
MKSKLFKRTILGLLCVLVLICFLMVIPRAWSALHPHDPPLGYHFVTPLYLAIDVGLETLINKTPEIPADIKEIKNIEYKNVNGQSLQLDMYIPQKKSIKLAPLLIFVHGGGWSGGKRSDYLVYLLSFAKKGYITATISYRLDADTPYPAAIEDVNDAVTWLSSHSETYGYDKNNIAIIGGSAGAHLALLAAYGWGGSVSHPIKAVVDLYGPTDLTTGYMRNHSLVTSFIGHPYEDSPELYKEASPITYLDSKDPPTLIFHGTSDELVPLSQSDVLKAYLHTLGVPVTYYRLPLWPHTMDVVKRVNDFTDQKMEDFFATYLK